MPASQKELLVHFPGGHDTLFMLTRRPAAPPALPLPPSLIAAAWITHLGANAELEQRCGLQIVVYLLPA
jgi:hypothetical protein